MTEPQNFDHEIPLEGKNPVKCITSFPSTSKAAPPPALIFTHGAGGSLHSDGVLNFRVGFARHSSITCFQGSMNLSSRVKMFDAVISDQSASIKAVGGRSMGARAAVMTAKDRPEIKNLVLASYPLHTGKGDVRDGILTEIEEEAKVIFAVGDRDSMCDLERLEGVRAKMKADSWLIRVEGADHGMTMKPKLGTKGVGELVGKVVAKWLKSIDEGELDEKSREGRIWWDGDDEVEKWSGWSRQQSRRSKENQEVKKPEKGKKGKGSKKQEASEKEEDNPKKATKQRGKRSQNSSADDGEPKKPVRKRRKA